MLEPRRVNGAERAAHLPPIVTPAAAGGLTLAATRRVLGAYDEPDASSFDRSPLLEVL